MYLSAIDDNVLRDSLDSDATFSNAVGELVEVWLNVVGRATQAQVKLIKVYVDIVVQHEGVDRDHEPVNGTQHSHGILSRTG